MSWRSYHVFYHNQLIFDKMLHVIFSSIIKKWKEDVPSFFFIRYWEGGPHIRLRFKAISQSQERELFEVVNQFFSSQPSTDIDKEAFYQNYAILFHGSESLPWYPNHSIQINTYIQETERYNGPQIMILSEAQFEFSSRYVLKLLSSKSISYQKKIYFGLQSIALMVRSMGISKQQEIDFMRSYCISSLQTYQPNKVEDYLKSYTDDLNKNDEFMRKIIQQYWSPRTQDNIIYKQYRSFAREVVKSVEAKTFEFNKITIGSIVKWDSAAKALGQLYWSWIHMHCNRLGISPVEEAQLTFLLSNSLKRWSGNL